MTYREKISSELEVQKNALLHLLNERKNFNITSDDYKKQLAAIRAEYIRILDIMAELDRKLPEFGKTIDDEVM